MESHLQKHEFMSWKNQRQTFEQGRKEVYFEARREGDALTTVRLEEMSLSLQKRRMLQLLELSK
jgi:hypothetical protein